MLTNAAVKAATPRSRAYKLADERGLFLFVTPTGLKSWRMKCRYQGRELLLTFGRYPEVTLAQARAQCDAARMAIASGADPRGDRATAAADTFESVARAWHAARTDRWSSVHAADVIASLERDVFPAIGAKRLAEIDEGGVLALLERVEARGRIETARRLRQRIDGVFRFARRRRLVGHNPADVADELAVRPPARPMPALTDIAECRALLAACENAGGVPIVRRAARFLALTAPRLGSLRAMTWGEIEDLDGAAPLWRIPPQHLKLAKAKKGEGRFAHLVPLAPAAVAVLRAVAADQFAGAGKMVDPAARVFPVGEAAIGALIARAGFKGRHVPHGWRASFSTIMNEAMPAARGTIDRALGHASGKDADIGNAKVEGAYNRSTLLEARRAVFEAWADALTAPAAR
ncbi:tyrosine-type recombinase/integrase [Sphingomonas sp.]|uniref:tyrosine-type recombinase/integrase n=1 Tax=Sphingomonas sp. TaxID=28214 RepID=UPI003F6E6965